MDSEMMDAIGDLTNAVTGGLEAIAGEIQGSSGGDSGDPGGAVSNGLEAIQQQLAGGVELGPTTTISIVAAILGSTMEPGSVTPHQLVESAETLVGVVYERTGANKREVEKFERMIQQAGLDAASPADVAAQVADDVSPD